MGNRLTEERTAGTTAYTYNDADELLTATGPTGTVTYAHDLNGNQIAAGARTFSYDLENRLVSTTEGTTSQSYSYDGDGKRLTSATTILGVPSGEIRSLWDRNAGLPQLTSERDGSGTLLRRYVHGQDLVSMTSGGAGYYFHHDGIGSVVNVTDGTGGVKWSYSYEPFGSLRSETPGVLPPENLMRFTGELWDQETGFYHLRARQYSPRVGRFLSRDPVPQRIDQAFVSEYAYASNRPTTHIDPSGERAFLLVGPGFWRQYQQWAEAHGWQLVTITTAAGCIALTLGACAGVTFLAFVPVQSAVLAQEQSVYSGDFWANAFCGAFKSGVLLTPAIGTAGAGLQGAGQYALNTYAASPTIVGAAASQGFASPGCGL